MAVIQSPPPTVAFLGLGAMGFAMSTHLLKQGVPVIGFDVWKPTLEKFQAATKSIPDAKASVASSPAEAAKEASIVLLMVANHHHVNSALFDADIGAVKTIPTDATIIICSTVPPTHPPEVRKRLDTEFSRPDIKLIDAPVSGGVVGSASGTLSIMASSNDPSALSQPAVKVVLSHLSARGQKLYIIPGGLGSGTSAKALNQVMCGTHIVGASEIMALAALQGLNTQQFYDDMRTSLPSTTSTKEQNDPLSKPYGWTWMFENRGPRMLNASLPIASATSIINKDVGIIKDEEDRLNVELPQLNKVHSTLTRCMNEGFASLDDALITQWYLGGLDSKQRSLVMDLATPSSSSSSSITPTSASSQQSSTDSNSQTKILLLAHSLINYMSAYETVTFAQALDLMGEEQRKMWFAIIAGAAGGSRVFSEVVPVAFAKMPNWQAGFTDYAKRVFGSSVEELEVVGKVVEEAKGKGVKPVLVETASAFVRAQLWS